MKKLSISTLIIASAVILQSGCTTINNMHDKLADMALQKKQLANGNTVYVNTNVIPTARWSCKTVGTQQVYNWQDIQTEGQFHLTGGAIGLLTNKALSYANQKNLKVNYINLHIPTEKTFSISSGRSTSSAVLNADEQAVASYYQCKTINPEHKVGWTKTEDREIRIGD